MSAMGVFCARIGRHHYVAFLFRLNKLLSDLTLNHFLGEVPAHRIATERVDLKALLQG